MADNDRIQAIKNGVKATFSQYEWALIAKARNGWEELGELKGVDKIPVEEVVVKEEIKEEAVVEKLTSKNLEVKTELTPDEMRSSLKKAGVKFHHKTGDVKIKVLYDENTK